jgi:hypothetical protein
MKRRSHSLENKRKALSIVACILGDWDVPLLQKENESLSEALCVTREALVSIQKKWFNIPGGARPNGEMDEGRADEAPTLINQFIREIDGSPYFRTEEDKGE